MYIYFFIFVRLFFIDKGELKSINPDGSDLYALNSVGSDDKVFVYKVRFKRETLIAFKSELK